MKIIQENWKLILLSILLICCGCYIFFNPITALITSAILIGIFLISLGIGYLILFKETKDSYALLALGLLDIFTGALFLTNLAISTLTLPIIFAFWVLCNSTIQFAMGLEAKSINLTNWKFIILSSFIGFIASIIIFIHPIIGTYIITYTLGGYLIWCGLFELHRLLPQKHETKNENSY